mgnify:CR=1 FL=1
MNSPEKLSSAGTTPNKQVRGADRPSDHRGWPPEQPWLKVRTGVAKSPDTCGSHAGIYSCICLSHNRFCDNPAIFVPPICFLRKQTGGGGALLL